MKYLKIILVVLVILGLILSYVIFDFRTPRKVIAPTDFKGPTEPPSVKGPSGPPPTGD